MERSSLESHEGSRSGRHAAKHFSDVVSMGPTAIPDNEQVAAALSSIARTSGQSPAAARQMTAMGSHSHHDRNVNARHQGGRVKQQQQQVRPASPGHRMPHATDRGASTVPQTNHRGNNPTVNDVGAYALGGGAPTKVAVPTASSDSGGGGGGIIDGLLSWAMWPLWGTIDALKWAGASVNEVAVAPAMRFAGSSAIAGALLTRLKAYTPQRARDLGRIVANTARNLAGLVHTEAGGEVLQSSVLATGSLAMAVSSPAGRQLMVESATGLVKLAEALDTPEAKNAIRQGTVVVARGMDLFASRYAKVFLQDIANVLVRFVELANSSEATVMAAEFTANVVHAMEMEHMSGMDGPRFASDAAANVHSAGATPGGPPRAHFGSATASTASVSTRMDAAGDRHAHGGAGARENGGEGDATAAVQHEQLRVSAPDDEPSVAASGALDEVAGLSVQSPVSPATSPSSGVGAESGTLQDRVTVEGRRAHVVDGGVLSEASNQTATTRTSDGERVRMVPTPITQADLDRNTRLRITHPPARTDRTAPSPRLGGARSAGAAAENTSSSQVSRRSAPSSPTGRRDSIRVSASDTASLARGERLGCRARASSESGGNGSGAGDLTLGQHDDDIQAGIAFASTMVGSETESGEEGAGLSGSGGTADPPVPAEYRRDGRHLLPRFSMERFVSVLRGRPVGLEDQLEAPDQNTLESVLSRAAIRFRQDSGGGGDGGSSRPDSAVGSANELSLAGAGDRVRDSERPPGGDGDAMMTTRAKKNIKHSINAVGFRGWIQVMFAFVLLLLAGDGLRYRLFGGRKLASNISSSAPSGRLLSDEGGRAEADTRFRAVFLPSTCRDASTGAAMAVWVTPSGPCLAPERASADAGAVGPACAASFRMCSQEEAWRS